MKKFIFIFCIVFISCSQRTEFGNFKESYFKFDNVDLYFLNISDDSLTLLQDKEKLAENDKILIDLMLYNNPKSISDENFISNLEKIKLRKTEIDSEKYDELSQIFSEKQGATQMTDACKPSYRNILIFKNDGCVTGIAKLCFNCQRYYIVGTNKNVENFGKSGEFRKLEKLIK